MCNHYWRSIKKTLLYKEKKGILPFVRDAVPCCTWKDGAIDISLLLLEASAVRRSGPLSVFVPLSSFVIRFLWLARSRAEESEAMEKWCWGSSGLKRREEREAKCYYCIVKGCYMLQNVMYCEMLCIIAGGITSMHKQKKVNQRNKHKR